MIKVVKEDVTYGPDELCLSMLKLDFGLDGQFSWGGHVWVSNTDSHPQLMVEQVASIKKYKRPEILSLQAGAPLVRQSTQCHLECK